MAESDAKFRETVEKSSIEDGGEIQKYVDFVQKDLILLMGEGLTPEGLYGYMTVENITSSLYKKLSDKYSEECRRDITFYTEQILSNLHNNEILEDKWFSQDDNDIYPLELSYKLSEEGVNLLRGYLKDDPLLMELLSMISSS